MTPGTVTITIAGGTGAAAVCNGVYTFTYTYAAGWAQQTGPQVCTLLTGGGVWLVEISNWGEWYLGGGVNFAAEGCKPEGSYYLDDGDPNVGDCVVTRDGDV